MAEKKVFSEKEIEKKIKDLKIELLKTPTKKARIKKEIARLLTMRKKLDAEKKIVDDKSNTKNKLVEGKK